MTVIARSEATKQSRNFGIDAIFNCGIYKKYRIKKIKTLIRI
jgi:hypothetical protein